MRRIETSRRGNAVLYGSALVVVAGAGLWAWSVNSAPAQVSPAGGTPPLEHVDGSLPTWMVLWTQS